MWYSGERRTGRTFRALLTCGLEASMGKTIAYQCNSIVQADHALNWAVKMFEGVAELKGRNLHFPGGGKIMFRIRASTESRRGEQFNVVDDWV